MRITLGKNTIRNLIERSMDLYAKNPCLAFVGDKPILYEHMAGKIHELASDLIGQGIEKGDRIAILGDNAPNWVIAYLTITSIGAVAVPILPGFPDADIRHILRDAETTALFISEKYRSALEELGKSHLRLLYSLENFHKEKIKSFDLNKIKNPIQELHKKFGKRPTHQEVFEASPRPEPEDLAAIIYTSGTTGFSKGVMLTHNNIVTDVIFGIEKFPIDSRDRFLSILPLSHTFEATGGMLCPLAVGICIYYMKGLPTPQKLLSAMETVKPTGVLTVPLVVDKIYRKRILPKLMGKKITAQLFRKAFFRKRLHQMAGKKLIHSLGGKLRFFMFGGASLNEDVEIFLRDAKISYATGYGMTETSPIITINPFGKVKLGSCGQPIPGIEVKIHDPDPQTGIGEIIVKGPIVMQGYYKNPEATRNTFLDPDWLRTGDLGYFDEEGYLFIKGRSKNVIVGSNGENIYPEIIEQQLLISPYIQEVIVYSWDDLVYAKAYLDQDVLDQEYERKAIPANQRDAYRKTILESIRSEINQQLPGFSKIKEIIEYPEPFEKTPTNKVKRYLYLPKVES
ncbi:AMP-binding protein [bacterium]|nr:AMP-binding protein [bacterium]